MEKRHLWFIVFLLFLVQAWGDFNQEFYNQFKDLTELDQQKELIQTFLKKAEAVDDHRTIQNYWLQIDKEECKEYYQNYLKSHKKDADANYLWARLEDNKKITKELGEKLIKIFPDNYWSYRITTANILDSLKNDSPGLLENKDFKKDIKLFEKGYKKFPDDGLNSYVKFLLLKKQGNISQAKKILKSINDPQYLNIHWRDINEFVEAEKDLELFTILYPKILQNAIITKQFEKADSLIYYQYGLLNYFQNTKAQKQFEQYLINNPKAQENPKLNGTILRTYFAFNQNDNALNLIEKMVKNEQLNYLVLENDESYEKLYELDRWKEILLESKRIWDNNKVKRESEWIQERLNKVASDWELNNVNDKKVKLSDHQGDIVILDFWATWCGPCRMVMPNLDKWMKDKMPEGIQVFSINIFEQEPEKAKTYFAENSYQMRLLFGNDEVADAYGVNSIPYICVIDKDGKIAYEQNGFSYDLEEKLSAWVDNLIKE